MSGGAIAIILARAGSRGLPGKNARIVAGRPMVAWSIDDARAAASVQRVLVTTDCPTVAEAARDAGVEVIERPAALATDTAPVCAALRHAVGAAGDAPPIVVALYANVPVRPAGLVERAVRALRGGGDSVQSYGAVGKHHPWWMVRLDAAGRVEPLRPDAPDRRQLLPPVFLPDGGVIAVRRDVLGAAPEDPPHAFLGADRRGIATAPGSVVDVDEALDLAVAEAALAARREVVPR